MNNRIIGFDMARAYAILGMYIVNFNTVFGSHTVTTGLSGFLNLFNGRSSTAFVILAGMGVSLMSNRPDYSPLEKSQLRRKVIRRSWFLFGIGLLLYTWWSADILHFYGGYMHVAAVLLFVPKRIFWLAAGAVLAIFHGLLLVIPYDTGWNFDTLTYTDFWTVSGFLRNTFYNGWNPLFPWLTFFLLGMWLGRLDWSQNRVKVWVFGVSEFIFLLTEGVQSWATHYPLNPDLRFYITANYLPPFLPFMLSTASFALVVIMICLEVGARFSSNALVQALAATGQMTLTHYVIHLTLGILLFWGLTGHAYTGTINEQLSESPATILAFALGFFALSVVFSLIWKRSFRHGPLESLMRWITG